MTKFKTVITHYVSDENGATAIEYGLIATLISVTIIGVSASIGGAVSDSFESTAASMG